MCMKKNTHFSIPAEHKPEKLLAKNYCFNLNKKVQTNSVLITSLGFGGTNGALMVKRHAQ